MEKIKKIELLVYTPEESFDFTQEVVKFLINKRVQHCYSELQEAIKNDEAGYWIHETSNVIVYKNGKHFSIPVYNHMVDFLNGDAPLDIAIVQQAIRSYQYMTCNDDLEFSILLNKYDKKFEDAFRTITDLIVLV